MTSDLRIPTKGLAVHLVKSESAGLPSLPPSAGTDEPMDASPAYPPIAAPVAQRSTDVLPMLPIHGQAEVRYFQLGELTQEPLVSHGLIGDKLLVVAGISPQSATVQVSIDDQGHVVRVILEDSQLSDEEKHLVIDAFLKVKFHPGKIGRIPVSSQMRMEIMLESEVKL
ncbi:hypothetical protein [Noviherbaspirillum denitrificans]|nr:hypothetical protein [Noviherbaspirillum denitrificans]